MTIKRRTIITLVVILGFVGILLYSTLAAQQVQCEACVTFNGETNCASASGASEQEALRTAVTTACGTLARGMDESIRCSNSAPQRPQCRTR